MNSLTNETRTAVSAVVDLPHWVSICAVDDIVPGTGVAALVDGEQVAIIRSPQGDALFGLSNFDPYSKAFVIARGIVGDKNGVLKIASPIYKQSFDLRTGVCLEEPAVALSVYKVRVADGRVEVFSESFTPTQLSDAE